MNRKLLTILVAVTAALAVLCCAGGTAAVFLLRPRNEHQVTLPRVPVRPSPSPSPSMSPPPAPLEADRVFQGRGSTTVPLAGLSTQVHTVAMTHQGSAGFAVNGLDRNGNIVALLGHSFGKFQGTMVLDGADRPAALQVRASGAWKLVVRDARRAPLWTGQGAGKASSVLRVDPPTAQPLAQVHYSHRGTSNFVIRTYGDGGSWDMPVNEIGRQDGTTTIPVATRYIEIEADGAWTLSRT